MANKMKKYINIKNQGVVETIDEFDSNEFESYLDFKKEVKRVCQEYILAGDNVYTSSRSARDWRNKNINN